jgi:hypothetical protein
MRTIYKLRKTSQKLATAMSRIPAGKTSNNLGWLSKAKASKMVQE